MFNYDHVFRTNLKDRPFLTECEWQDERCHKCNHVSTTNQSVSPFPHKKQSQFANTHILSRPLFLTHKHTHFLSHATYILFHSVTHTHTYTPHGHTQTTCLLSLSVAHTQTHTDTHFYSQSSTHIFYNVIFSKELSY